MVTMEKPYFRVGVGIILYDSQGDVLCFQRADNPSLWQFPQGGVDAGETYEATLWRELFEETAIPKEMIVATQEYPDWTLYEYPKRLHHQTGAMAGQVHRWYFLEIKPGGAPNLEVAADKEFVAWQTLTMSDFLALPGHDFKLPVYEKLADYYKKQLV